VGTPSDEAPASSDAPQDEQFVAALVQEHGKAMVSYAARLTGDRHLAEDIVQDALVRAWQHRADLVDERGSVRGRLLTVIRRLAIDRARARTARPHEVAENPARPPVQADHADQVVAARVVLDAIDGLSEDHRSVLVELYFRDLSVADAADVLGVPAGTVKSRSYYALRQLRDKLARAAS
jgi:RNA polymerase sigma-70 factor (ECF subfamily)